MTRKYTQIDVSVETGENDSWFVRVYDAAPDPNTCLEEREFRTYKAAFASAKLSLLRWTESGSAEAVTLFVDGDEQPAPAGDKERA